MTASTAAIDELIRRYEAGEEIDWNKIEDKHLVVWSCLAVERSNGIPCSGSVDLTMP